MKTKFVSAIMAGAITVSALFAPFQVNAMETGNTELPGNIIATADIVDDGITNPLKVPSQYNVHMGDDPSTQVNFTYTTAVPAATQVVLNKEGDNNTIIVPGSSTLGSANKYFHMIAVSGLEPNTNYEYTVGYGANIKSGKFLTAPAQGSKDSFRFIYLADTQVSNASNAKALGATLDEVNKMGASFVYLAGDVTDTATNETQWEQLFYNNGKYSNGGQDMFANNLVSVIQGNHDNNTMNSHINAPALAGPDGGKIVYSFDYGSATFIMLNLESARSDATARATQREYLERCIADAKARGQWTIVGFHKSLYSGASHIVDSDIVEARKYWCPIFAELDVDMVLQGHDHVYSRGFINADGTNANATAGIDGKVENPLNAPLYMVGGHAGGLKWYSKVNYSVSTGDPLVTNYAFLDKNSTDDNSDIKQEQVIVELEVSNTEVKINCWMFKYDTDLDEITTQKYLYDSMTLKRTATADINGTDMAIAGSEETVNYTVSYDILENANVFSAEVEYDEDVLEFVGVETGLSGVILNNAQAKNGKATVILGTNVPVSSSIAMDIVTFNFKVKGTAAAGNTTIKLVKADTVKLTYGESGKPNAEDISAKIGKDKVLTMVYSYKYASDINKDGIVTLADLAIALTYYQTDEKSCDINLDGIVNIEDYLIIISYINAT